MGTQDHGILLLVNTPGMSANRHRGLGRHALWVPVFGVVYVLSTGPVAWATNDGLHPRYLPEEVNVIYLPLQPLMKIPWIERAFYYYTAVLWGGWPAGHTTL